MRSAIRFATALAVGALLSLSFTPQFARESGRNYARCINACNTIRQDCDRRCSDDCRELFPNNTTQRNACQNSCKDSCVDAEKDCKDVCQANKDQTPEVP